MWVTIFSVLELGPPCRMGPHARPFQNLPLTPRRQPRKCPVETGPFLEPQCFRNLRQLFYRRPGIHRASSHCQRIPVVPASTPPEALPGGEGDHATQLPGELARLTQSDRFVHRSA